MKQKTYVSPAIRVISLEGLDDMAIPINNSNAPGGMWSRKKELEDWELDENSNESAFPWDEEK